MTELGANTAAWQRRLANPLVNVNINCLHNLEYNDIRVSLQSGAGTKASAKTLRAQRLGDFARRLLFQLIRPKPSTSSIYSICSTG